MSRIETIAEGVTLYLGDCREILPGLAPAHAIITSPPYGQQRDYGSKINDWQSLVSGALCAVKDAGDTQIFVNLGMIHRDGEVIEYWSGFFDDMRAAGWRLFGWYVWDKQDAMAGDWNGRLAPAHEFVFHFNKTARKPNKVVTCKGAGLLGYKGNTGLRRPDGSLSGWTGMGKPTQDFKIADSVIRIQPQKDRTNPLIRQHPAVYPVDLPRVFIDSYTSAGEIIVDPFLGSGTTGVAAINQGRGFIGIELHEPYFDVACRRLEAAMKQPDMFIESPKLAPPEQIDMLSNSDN